MGMFSDLKIEAFTGGGGNFFKPQNYAGATALLVVPQRVEQRHSKKFDKMMDNLHADIYVFPDEASLTGGEVIELPANIVGNTYMVSDGAAFIGKAFVCKLKQVPTKGQDAWVWDKDVDPSIVKAVIAWAQKRESDIEAAAAEAPDEF